tara:strand:- start:91441 stop:91902 length:462 start_codon:yes stop_codon:yes gene_type:complete
MKNDLNYLRDIVGKIYIDGEKIDFNSIKVRLSIIDKKVLSGFFSWLLAKKMIDIKEVLEILTELELIEFMGEENLYYYQGLVKNNKEKYSKKCLDNVKKIMDILMDRDDISELDKPLSELQLDELKEIKEFLSNHEFYELLPSVDNVIKEILK